VFLRKLLSHSKNLLLELLLELSLGLLSPGFPILNLIHKNNLRFLTWNCPSVSASLKGYWSSVWILIEHIVMVSGNVYVFLWGLWFVIGQEQLSY